MRILIPIFSPHTGTMGPHTRALAVGSQAIESGHDVAYCASGRLCQLLKEQQYLVYSMPEPTILGLPKLFSTALERRMKNMTPPIKPGKSFGNIWFVLWFTGMTNKTFLKQLLDAQLNAVKDFQPDALFTELDPASYLVAEITGIPLATTYAKIALEGSDSFAYRHMERVAKGLMHIYGKTLNSLSKVCFGQQVLKIIPSIPELDGTDPTPRNVCYVGHLLKEPRATQGEPFSPAPGKRHIFVYMGTGSLKFSRLETVLPQVFSEDSPYHCIVASEHVNQTYRVGSVEFCNYVSAAQLLPHCDWTICHGGHNTIIQSLLHHVPLLVFPGAIFERRFNASMVENTRCGVMGEVVDFTPSWINSKLKLQEELGKNAKQMGRKLQTYKGAKAAVEAIEDFVKSRQKSKH